MSVTRDHFDEMFGYEDTPRSSYESYHQWFGAEDNDHLLTKTRAAGGRIDDHDPYFRSLSDNRSAAISNAFANLPDFELEVHVQPPDGKPAKQ